MESNGTLTHKKLASDDMQRIQTLVESIESAVLISQDDRICYVNTQAQTLSGYSKDELLCMPFSGILHKDFRSQAKQGSQPPHIGGNASTSYDVKVVRKNGPVRWVNFRNSTVSLGGKPAILSVGDDITERKLTERCLQEGEDKQKLLEAQKIARLGYYIYDIQADLWTCPLSLDNFFGIDKNYRKDINGWLHIIHPDFQEAISDYLKADILVQHKKFDMEYKIINQATGEERWVHGLGALRFDDNNNPFEMHGTIQDITDRKKAGELPAKPDQAISKAGGEIVNFVDSCADISATESQDIQLFQARKMEALGTLVGGIAHDFNNMLASIDGYLYLAKDLAGEMPDVINKLSHIERISSRAAGMISQLLIFSRKDTAKRKRMVLGRYVRQALEFIRTSVPENITFKQDICSDALQINGDETQIHQILLSLINNARDALAGAADPCITVTLDAFKTDDEFIKHHPYFIAGRYAHFSVQDNGCGIREQQFEHLFEPFFTTKAVNEGAGLGLAVVYGIVKNHDGFINMESVEGEGSTFHFYIPLLESEEIASESAQDEVVAEGYSELILVADDEPNIRETTSEVLESMGYNVLQAEDGLEAIEIFTAHQDEINLAILDIVMPHLGGIQLAGRLRQLKPDLPIIFITGYDKDEVFDRGESLPYCTVLSKPVQFSALSQQIRGLLDAREASGMKNVINFTQ